MARDYGFELPDVRVELATVDEGTVKIKIIRHWFTPEGGEEDDPQFKVSFDIGYTARDGREAITSLPIGTTEDKAEEIARILYEIDEDGTRQIEEVRAMEEAERRLGC